MVSSCAGSDLARVMGKADSPSDFFWGCPLREQGSRKRDVIFDILAFRIRK